MLTMWYPLEDAEEIGKLFVSGKLAELPDFVKRVNLLVAADGEVKVYSLYEIQDDKVPEGFIAITKRLAGYRVTKGVRYKIEPVLEAKDALALIGL